MGTGLGTIFPQSEYTYYSRELYFCGFCSSRILLYFPLSACVCVCACTGKKSHISHIYKGIYAMWIIRGSIKPYILWINIFQAIFLVEIPYHTIFSTLTNLTIDFDWSKDPHSHWLLCLVNDSCLGSGGTSWCQSVWRVSSILASLATSSSTSSSALGSPHLLTIPLSRSTSGNN